jgi:RNA-directed DNA polymerase
VLNIDLKDFFPTINFGRVRGLFMKPPFGMGPAAASVMAQICTDKNGLPQGAPTSPILSNMIAASLDRKLARLAREQRLKYSRYADDITFSSKDTVFPPAIAIKDAGPANAVVRVGPDLERVIKACGFAVNEHKVRLQTRHVQQNVTGLIVNQKQNVERERIRKVRAMIHAWRKFGLDAAAREHFAKYHSKPGRNVPHVPDRAFRNPVYGQLAFIKMVRGKEDAVFLKLCAQLIDLDPNPSKFIRQMVFGANDFDVFISHASEDKEAIARPIYNACVKVGVKSFLDEAHSGWGENFTKKINVALGAARTVLVIVSNNSVSKDWPLAEINAALAMEVKGHKQALPLVVGKLNLAELPLIRTRACHFQMEA